MEGQGVQGVEKVAPLSSKANFIQAFDELTEVKSRSSIGSIALKLRLFLVGNEFRLRILVGELFVPQTLPHS